MHRSLVVCRNLRRPTHLRHFQRRFTSPRWSMDLEDLLLFRSLGHQQQHPLTADIDAEGVSLREIDGIRALNRTELIRAWLDQRNALTVTAFRLSGHTMSP